ncbi:uncharacterized protein LOC121255631 isoform X2 [Juglans microcarpa x Juglans regia]|uniref:uncharacterized protein LOC121255631 isoform X2 n=1 Tax=Juglans microcarpa x Juglans regia TaxID=2249226 RepID=UPI001B7E0015|nr:uncharacterized protein LOC121255631 isoform X2 [Juglans microcarpa x Juglans regia]
MHYTLRNPHTIKCAIMASALALFFIFNLASFHALPDVVLEDGYTVSTVINGHKLRMNPHSVLPRSGSSDLIVLDSANSVFYTISFPASQESVVKRLSGDGVHEYLDGKLSSARFNKPQSFAIDLKGNVYVADIKSSRTIRKISDSGVTTIAGGYSEKAGYADGPAQNASFSDDLEISFIPELCALLISDHGSQLVRHISLKAEDCAQGSNAAMGAVSTWLLGLGLSCLLGLIVGIAVRPYIIPSEGSRPLLLSETWKHRLILLGKPVLILCFDIKSAAASSPHYALLRRLFWLSLSHISLMFRINKVKPLVLHKETISLIDSDDTSSCKITKSEMYDEQLRDLINLDRSLELLNMADLNHDYDSKEGSTVLSSRSGRIDTMIQDNIMGLEHLAKETTPMDGSLVAATSGLVKRK